MEKIISILKNLKKGESIRVSKEPVLEVFYISKEQTDDTEEIGFYLSEVIGNDDFNQAMITEKEAMRMIAEIL